MREYDGCDYPMSLIYRCTVKLKKQYTLPFRHTRSEERTVWYPCFALDASKWTPACASMTVVIILCL